MHLLWTMDNMLFVNNALFKWKLYWFFLWHGLEFKVVMSSTGTVQYTRRAMWLKLCPKENTKYVPRSRHKTLCYPHNTFRWIIFLNFAVWSATITFLAINKTLKTSRFIKRSNISHSYFKIPKIRLSTYATSEIAPICPHDSLTHGRWQPKQRRRTERHRCHASYSGRRTEGAGSERLNMGILQKWINTGTSSRRVHHMTSRRKMKLESVYKIFQERSVLLCVALLDRNVINDLWTVERLYQTPMCMSHSEHNITLDNFIMLKPT